MAFEGDLVAKEGTISLDLMKRITAGGGDGQEELKRVLTAGGWTEESGETVAIPSILWSQGDKRLKGSSWKLVGPKVETMFEATDMWEGLNTTGADGRERKVNVRLVFPIHKFVFPTEGEFRATSQWLSFEVSQESQANKDFILCLQDAESYEIKWADTAVDLTDEDMNGAGILQKDVAVRLQILVTGISAAMIYMGIAPVSKARLPQIGTQWKMKQEAGQWPIRVGYWIEGKT